MTHALITRGPDDEHYTVHPGGWYVMLEDGQLTPWFGCEMPAHIRKSRATLRVTAIDVERGTVTLEAIER